MPSNSISISVLLASYNYPVVRLVNQLHQQLLKSKITFEILCFDDCPDTGLKIENMALNSLSHVTFKINNRNLGRAENRNTLAQAAQFNFLLFLDSDADLSQNPDFIANYIKAAQENTVVCGGTSYKATPPENAALHLRYIYGKEREEKPADIRQKEQWTGFSAFNFLIPKTVFFNLKFNERFSKYGHEDTLFGNELKYRCIPVKHINNAALHLGLDTTKDFLAKTRQAVENLKELIDLGLVDEDVKLYAWYVKMRKMHVHTLLGKLFINYHKKWEVKLTALNPSLKLYDFYKLSYLCSLPLQHRTPPKRKI